VVVEDATIGHTILIGVVMLWKTMSINVEIWKETFVGISTIG
jgi:hypothetical protein